MKDIQKEITKILTQLSGKTFNSPKQVNEFFELALWRIARIKDENWEKKIEEALPEEVPVRLGDFHSQGRNDFLKQTKKNLNLGGSNEKRTEK